MNNTLKKAIINLDKNTKINSADLSAYIDGKLNAAQQNKLESDLSRSASARKELSIIIELLQTNPFENKKPQTFWLQKLLKNTPAFAFVFFLTILLGFWWQSQDQLAYVGISEVQYKQLPKETKTSVNQILKGQMPEKLFQNVVNDSEIYRTFEKVEITPQYPLFSKVTTLDELRWQAGENNDFTVLIINDKDELVEMIENSQIENDGKNYKANMGDLKFCNNCQYAWRVMNNKTSLATRFIPFEYAPLDNSQVNNLPDGLAKLSFYWFHGYLHNAFAELNNIKDTKDSNKLKSTISKKLNNQMRK